jgi:hypothetical protein
MRFVRSSTWAMEPYGVSFDVGSEPTFYFDADPHKDRDPPLKLDQVNNCLSAFLIKYAYQRMGFKPRKNTLQGS